MLAYLLVIFRCHLYFGREFFELVQVGPRSESPLDDEQLPPHVAAVKILQVLKVGVEVDEVDDDGDDDARDQDEADGVRLLRKDRRRVKVDGLLRPVPDGDARQ